MTPAKKEADEEEEEEEEEESNIEGLFNAINVALGVGESVADDADWFDISIKNRNSQ